MTTSKQDRHLRHYLKIISKRRLPALTFCLATVALVAAWLFTTEPLYEASTKVLIEKGTAGDLTGDYRYYSYDPEFFGTQAQLIRSRAVARRVVDTAVAEGWDFSQEAREETPSWWQRLKTGCRQLAARVFPTMKEESAEREVADPSPMDLVAAQISSNIRVRPVENTKLVAISFLSPDPEFSALVANAAAKAYLEQTLSMKMDATRDSLEWMNEKAETERIKLEKAEKAMQDYMRSNDIVTLEDRLAITPERLSEVSTQLTRAESARKDLEASYQQMRGVEKNPEAVEAIPAVASDPTLQALRMQIVAAEKAVMELAGKFGPKHPVMAKAAADLEVLKEKKRQEVRRIIRSVGNEYELARARENALRNQLGVSKTEALRLNERFIQYGALKREVETSRQLYDALMLKLKEERMTEETKPVDLWIVEAAEVPMVPARPQKGKDLFLGLLLGIFGGIGLALFLDYLDNRIKDPEQTEIAFGLPLLGIVPLNRDKAQETEGIVQREPLSPLAESYKSIRTALLLSQPDSPPRRILVTSPTMGEGKTTTAVNLAIALAQSEKRVVLIDADLRKPRLHQVFRLNNDTGMSTFLAGGVGDAILRKGPLPNLSIIPCGPIPPNPSELLASARMKQLVQSIGNDFDIIIADSPPVLSVADSRILSRLFDGTLLVSQSRKTSMEVVEKALKSLRSVKAHLLGLVINGLELHPRDDYYRDYYRTTAKETEPRLRARLKAMAGKG